MIHLTQFTNIQCLIFNLSLTDFCFSEKEGISLAFYGAFQPLGSPSEGPRCIGFRISSLKSEQSAASVDQEGIWRHFHSQENSLSKIQIRVNGIERSREEPAHLLSVLL